MEILKFCFVLCIVLTLTKIVNCEEDTGSPKSSEAALIIVDFQNDFCEGGSIALKGSDKFIPIINDLRTDVTFAKVIFTMDWHPPGHISFYERFSDKTKWPQAKLFHNLTFDLGDGRGQRTQRLWPVHCVQNSTGAALRDGLKVLPSDVIVFKGVDIDVDSYSAFGNEAEGYQTDLDEVLKGTNIKEIVVIGLAWEYCVGNTALDGIKKGYKVTVLEDATAFFGNSDTEVMRLKFANAGVKVMTTKSFMT